MKEVHHQEAIYPGQIWLDTEGKRIQAHAGNLFYENGKFYWYGENKEHTRPNNGIWTWGIRYYSSTDMYNWKDEGLLIPPNEDDPESPLHPSKYIDRPHILYNANTGKYVCWLKISGMDVSSHCFVLLTADQFSGPYEIVNESFRPHGLDVGDFSLVTDEETRHGYLFVESNHERTLSFTLTDDYLGVTDEVHTHFEGLLPPYCREGQTSFTRNGLHYLLTSGMTGYIPNPSEAAVSASWHGPYDVKWDPHVNDESSASFNSQIGNVFKHPLKKDLYIALADRWVPDFVMTGDRYREIESRIRKIYENGMNMTPEDFQWYQSLPFLEGADTSRADYVWLPLRFEGDRCFIDWKESWKIEDYE